MKKLFSVLAMLIAVQFSYAQNTYPWPSTGNVGIGVTTPLTINSSASLFSSATPLVEMRTGTSTGNDPYSELVTIRHIGVTGTATSRQLGLVFKLSDESSQNESNKMGGISLGTSNSWANLPVLSLLTGNAKRLNIDQSGNVGIGTTSPQYKLDIYKGAPGSALNITGAAYGTRNDVGMDFSAVNSVIATYARIGLQISNGGTGVETGGLTFSTVNNGSLTEKMFIDATGNVAIGTTDPQGHKLAVNGDIIATSIKVKPYGNWPDYVFKPSYTLPSLSEVKSYIDQNQHLPDMPSEQEVAREGVDLGEIVKLQTKKIEELTLYIIEKDKEVKAQQEEINNTQNTNLSQQNEIELLKQSLEALTKEVHKN